MSELMDQVWGKVLEGRGFSKYLWKNFTGDRCPNTAASLTYQTLFAVVPFLTIMYALFDRFEAFSGQSERIESFIFDNIVPENVSVVQGYLLGFSEQARNLGGPSLILLMIAAFLMLYTIEGTFNEIWRVKEPRHGLQRFLVYWGVLTLGAPFILLSLAVTTYIQSLPFLSDVTKSTGALNLVPLVIGSSFFSLVFAVVPNCIVPLRHAVVGGILTAFVFEVAKTVFAVIMAQSNYAAIYGTFAAVPLFLLWIYISWTIILFGAEFVKGMGVYRFGQSEAVEPPLSQMVFLLELFYRAHQRGEVVTEEDIRKHSVRINMEQWTDYKSRLMDLDLIRMVEKGGLVLSKDLKEVSVWDLYTNLPWQLPHQVVGDKAWEKKLSSRFSGLYEDNREALGCDLESLFTEN